MNGFITQQTSPAQPKSSSSQTTIALKNSSGTTSQSHNRRSSTSSSLKQQQDPSNDINPDDICSPHELIGWVDNVLEKLETKFSGVETEVLQRLDSLGKRIDSLELSMSTLLDGASNPNPTPNQPSEVSTTSPVKSS